MRRLGNVVSHAPVLDERLMRLLSKGVAVKRMLESVWLWWLLWNDFVKARLEAAVRRCSWAQKGVLCTRESVRRLVASVEAEKQAAPVVVGSGMPSPPKRTGRAMRERSWAASWTVESRRAGRKISAIAVSSGAKA